MGRAEKEERDTVSGLIRPDGELVNGSASQRRIAALQNVNDNLVQQVAHLKAHLAAIIVAHGGVEIIPVAALAEDYKIEVVVTEDQTGLIWTVTKEDKTPKELAPQS